METHPTRKHAKLHFVHYIIFNTDTNVAVSSYNYIKLEYVDRLSHPTGGVLSSVLLVEITIEENRNEFGVFNLENKILHDSITDLTATVNQKFMSSSLLVFLFEIESQNKLPTSRGGGTSRTRHIFLETRNCAIWLFTPIEGVIVSTCLLK